MKQFKYNLPERPSPYRVCTENRDHFSRTQCTQSFQRLPSPTSASGDNSVHTKKRHKIELSLILTFRRVSMALFKLCLKNDNNLLPSFFRLSALILLEDQRFGLKMT